jgi:hypothetical protein
MPDLPKKPEMVGRWSWSTELLVDAVGQASPIAGFAVVAGLIIRDVVSKNRALCRGRK